MYLHVFFIELLFMSTLLCICFTGTSANAEHFQAFLLEGLSRWNEDRAAAAAVDPSAQVLRCYSGHLQHSLNQLSQQLLSCKLVADWTKPGEYTGNYSRQNH